MSDYLGEVAVIRKTGQEVLHYDQKPTGFGLLDFWQWSTSDLLTNTVRGVLAEFIVAKALGASTAKVRDPWAAYDLKLESGLKIEVKSAAYLQSWKQAKLSSIQFNVGKHVDLDATAGKAEPVRARHADLYVFAILDHKDKRTVDPLNLSQWVFYVVPTSKLDERERSQHSIMLKSLEGELGAKKCEFHQLLGQVQQLSREHRLPARR